MHILLVIPSLFVRFNLTSVPESLLPCQLPSIYHFYLAVNMQLSLFWCCVTSVRIHTYYSVSDVFTVITQKK